MDEMPKVDPRGADLLAAFREGTAAPAATREQLLSRVEASAAGTSRAWLAGLAVLLLGGVTIAAWPSPSSQVDVRDTTMREREVVTSDGASVGEPPAPVVVTPTMAPAAQDEPIVAPPAPEEPTAVEEPAPEAEPAPAQTRRSKHAPKAGTDAPPTELELIARAKKALAAGKARSALTATKEHATAYPRGVLVEERLLLEIEARCELGQTGRVDELRDRFLARHSASPLADRVRHSCQETSQ